MWYAIGAVFVGGMIALNRFLKHRERQGDWDKEGHGSPAHPEPGVKYRPLEVPPQTPFD
jgi:hypothetical protein